MPPWPKMLSTSKPGTSGKGGGVCKDRLEESGGGSNRPSASEEDGVVDMRIPSDGRGGEPFDGEHAWTAGSCRWRSEWARGGRKRDRLRADRRGGGPTGTPRRPLYL